MDELNYSLNDEQQKTFNENYKLINYTIYPWLKRYKNYDKDDFTQIASIAIIESIKKYDINKGTKFNTFAVNNINHKISRYIQKDIRKHGKNTYIKDIENSNDNKYETYLSLQYEDDLINKIYCNEIIVIMQNILSNDYTNKNQYDIINTYINNPYISQKSIALKMGVSQSWVSYVLKKFKQKVCNKLVS